METTTKNATLFSKFVLVGIINTARDYGLFALFLKLGNFYLGALTLSHIIATINSYIWNRKFTFRSKENIKGEFIRFVSVYALMFLVNFLLLYIAVDVLKFQPLAAQLAILAVIVAVSFIGQKYFTFRISTPIN